MGRQLVDKLFIELQLLRVRDLVEFDYEVGVKVHENVNAINQLFDNLKGPLSFYDGGLRKGLLKIINYLDVPFLGLLNILALSRPH